MITSVTELEARASIEGKEENAGYENFLLSPHCQLLRHVYLCSLKMLSISASKILCCS